MSKTFTEEFVYKQGNMEENEQLEDRVRSLFGKGHGRVLIGWNLAGRIKSVLRTKWDESLKAEDNCEKVLYVEIMLKNELNMGKEEY